jgi:transposase
LYDEQIHSVEGKIDQMMKLTDTKIMSIPGLDPVVSQSGRFENKNGKISKRGSPLLCHALFLAANTAIQTID